MRRYLWIAIISATASCAVAQAPGKAPDLVGVSLGMNQADALKRTAPVFPPGDYYHAEFSSEADHRPSGFSYNKIHGRPDRFAVGFSDDGTINFIIHSMEYNEPDAPAASGNGSKTIQLSLGDLWKKKKKSAPDASAPAPARTDQNLRPTMATFVDTLIQKYGPPSERNDFFTWYRWDLDDDYRPIPPGQVPEHCKGEPSVPVGFNYTPYRGVTGMYYPMPPTAAYSDCKIGIWAKLTTRKIDNQDIVMDYTIKIYNQSASFKDMRKRKAAIPPPIPDNAHRPVL